MAMKTSKTGGGAGAGAVSSFGALSPSTGTATRMGASSPSILTSTPSGLGGDFITLEEPKRQANILIFGDGGTGKTSFVTRYCPTPIALINFDRRAGYAVANAKQAGRVIHYLPVDFPAHISKVDIEPAKKLGQDALDRVIANYELAVTASIRGDVRTICLDTGTELSEIMKIAFTGRVDRTKGDYGQSKDLINRQWWRLLNTAREGLAHLVILARGKAVWEGNEPTGEFTYRGPEVMNDGVDWSGQIKVRQTKRMAQVVKSFEIKMTKCGVNIEELGKTYTEKDWEGLGGPFVYGSLMQYEGSNISDWE